MRRYGCPDNHLLQGRGPLRDVKLRPVQVLARGLGQPVLQEVDGRGDAEEEDEGYLWPPGTFPFVSPKSLSGGSGIGYLKIWMTSASSELSKASLSCMATNTRLHPF